MNYNELFAIMRAYLLHTMLYFCARCLEFMYLLPHAMYCCNTCNCIHSFLVMADASVIVFANPYYIENFKMH